MIHTCLQVLDYRDLCRSTTAEELLRKKSVIAQGSQERNPQYRWVRKARSPHERKGRARADTMFLGGSSSSGSDNGTASSNDDRERSSLPRSLRSRKSSVPAASSIAGASSRTSRSSDGAKGRS